MSEMEKIKGYIMMVLDTSRLSKIGKISLLNGIIVDIKNEFEEIKSEENKNG